MSRADEGRGSGMDPQDFIHPEWHQWALGWLSGKDPPANQKMQVRSLGREDPLEKEMATHSSILAGKSHGQRGLENPSGL